MGFKCGLVGLPNVGKSTLFNLLTKLNVSALNFPFCTIKPNIGIVPVLDNRLNVIKEIIKPDKTIPTTMQLIDIAGLVKGASKGEGLGNQFLSNIRETDVILHVVRCFKNETIVHVYSKINPVNDIEIIETELILSDIEKCEKLLSNKKSFYVKEQQEQKRIINLCLSHLKKNNLLNTIILNEKEMQTVFIHKFLTIKPTIYIANVNGIPEDKEIIDEINYFAKKKKLIIIPICLNKKKESLVSNAKKNNNILIKKLNNNAEKIIKAGYDLLQLETFFTVGKKEVKGWTIKKNSTAPEAAKIIHSDFKKGFIRAKVISFNDFILFKKKNKKKEPIKYRLEGKNYIVKDGDIIHFLFNN